MNFYVSEKYKRSGKRKTILAALLVVGIIAVAAWMFIASDSFYHKILAATITLLLIKHLPGAYKSIKNNDSSYPIVAIIESENKIDISHKGAVVSMPLSDIESLRIQSAKGNIKSLLLTTKSFSNLRFEGYENLAEMAELLKKYTPAGKIKNATWYHR
ncbi:hypothetical protein LRS11_20715 [Pseudomonas sp. J452]|uniref:hypothetical protein n=1 Tax=Pseudomonas sp. J452 TaxID=2898441 RepID=UPI0021ADBC57|nr:hypothetical protein [Pseudomonas sp. J452]UUY07359.1 hypothetical protein LRS11_16220 [Pseudomonas sp. J452]UUY08191.1 hypothetical protein LRS11_20715 [Pseudomonas sp. J452]